MKKRIYVALCAAGIALVTGCMSFENMKKKADAGDGYMAYRTGVRLKNGIGVKANHEQAMVYFGKAAKAGYEPRGLTVIEVEHRDTFGSRWDIAAAWEVVTQAGVEQSKLFGDCYELLWDSFSVRNRNILYEKGLNYLKLLQMKGKDDEAYALKKRLIAIRKKKPSRTREENVFLKNLEKIQTKAEILERKRIAEQKRIEKQKRIEEQRRIAEQKMKNIKYASPDLIHGMKLYKHLTSGISLEWFILETLSKDGQIKCLGKGNYFLILSSTAYPGVTFKFSSNKKDSEMTENINWSKYNQMNLSDPQGVLFEVEISLPGNIDSKKIYQKYCNEYPQIKPVLKQNNYEKPIPVPSQARGYRMKIKSKRGQCLWKNDRVYISFSFVDKPEIMVSGPDPDNVEMLKRTFERQQQEMGMGIRKVLIRDEKLSRCFVASKIEKEKNAIKAKEDAVQKAALDF